MTTLALTGGIACGKSLFGRLLAEAGAEVVDADDVVRALHAPGGAAAREVARTFGSAYLAADGSTDRPRLAGLVFADAAARRRLEEFVHPLVRTALLAWKNAPSSGARVRAAQIPLLFESEWRRDWDFAVTVETSDEALRLARLTARGLSPDEARARIASQLPAARREELADFVVRNDGSVEELRAIAQALVRSLSKNQEPTT